MNEDIQAYLSHLADHTFHDKMAAAHKGALEKIPADKLYADRRAFHTSAQEAHEERRDVARAIMNALEKTIVTENLNKLRQAVPTRPPTNTPDVDPLFEWLFVSDEREERSPLQT